MWIIGRGHRATRVDPNLKTLGVTAKQRTFCWLSLKSTSQTQIFYTNPQHSENNDGQNKNSNLRDTHT